MAEIPKIRNMLEMLLPIILPIPISAFPFRLATILTKSSGADVPKETIVSPITKSEMPMRLAMELEMAKKASGYLNSGRNESGRW